MKAVVMHAPGGPEVLQLEERPVPTPRAGEILIRVKAFGLNRSELFTRQGHSPNVTLPRVLGIEATGIVERAPAGEVAEGRTVVTAMGGMGRQFDGGYAEYVCVPARQVLPVDTTLPWERLAALPEMMQTAWGSLFRALRLQPRDRLLVRGGTTSVGLAAAAIARHHGAEVIATTRSPASRAVLGPDALLDDGAVAPALRAIWPDGADKVLELVGTRTLLDSLRCAREGGLVCMSGIVGNAWSLDGFNPMEAIPTAVGLTAYSGDVADLLATPLAQLASWVEDGTLQLPPGKTFRLDEIVEAHRCMEENRAAGKIVVLT